VSVGVRVIVARHGRPATEALRPSHHQPALHRVCASVLCPPTPVRCAGLAKVQRPILSSLPCSSFRFLSFSSRRTSSLSPSAVSLLLLARDSLIRRPSSSSCLSSLTSADLSGIIVGGRRMAISTRRGGQAWPIWRMADVTATMRTGTRESNRWTRDKNEKQ
jgi:hypothetical protein